MAQGSDDCLSDKTPASKESESNKSFVKKVKSRVSGFLPSSISKWFGTTDSQVRQREDSDEDEEFFDIQPPSKRIKPSLADHTSHGCFASTDRVNHVEKKIIGSIFPEPVAGPSGVQSRKTFTPTRCAKYRRVSGSQDVFNGDKYSDSGESTSGYSSMPKIGSKEQLAETSEVKNVQTPVNVNATKRLLNTTSTINERSLFNEKSPSPQQANSSLSSRQPAFNTSVFGSPNFVDRTISSKRIMNSPFYNGRTIYGGASAYGRNLGQPSYDPKLPLRNIVQIKPVNDKVLKDNAVLSKTARRILDTLEQYTTPIAEAKKIPNPSLRRPLKNIGTSPYTIRESRVPSNKELQVPTVPDLLKMKLKERLQDSTVSVRQIATNSKSLLNTEEYSIKGTDEGIPKHTNKIKAKVSNVRQKAPVENVVAPEVKLPDIQLPISTLPKFDFSLSTPPSSKKPSKTETTFTSTATTLKTITKTFPNKEETKTTSTKEETLKTETSKVENDEVSSRKTENFRTETNSSQKTLITEYKFAEPLILAENIKSIKAINNFIFSEPLSKKRDKSALEVPDIPNNFKPPCENKNFQPTKPDFNKETAPNVLTWECPICLTRNIPGDAWCKACNLHRDTKEKLKASAKQRTPNAVDKNSFGGKFKLTSDKWECATCLVRNNVADNKCVACTTPRGGAPNTTTTTASGFGDKFKLPSNSWECTVCMIRNKNELTKCMACEASRPAGNKTEAKTADFGCCFKKKEGEWECDSCMVRNSADLNKCQCCEAAKPGTTPTLNLPKEKSTLSTFNFGIDKSSVTNTHGFTPLATISENGPAATSIFGQSPLVAAPTSTPVTFSFGIKPIKDQPATLEDNSSKPTILNVEKSEEVNVKPTGFVLGANTSTPANSFVFKEPLPVVTNSANTENVKDVSKSNKPVSLNGDINKSESVIKSVSSSIPQLNSSLQTNSTVCLPESGKDTVPNLYAFGAKPQPQPQQQQELPQPLFGGSNNNDGQSSTLFKFIPTENKTVVNDKSLFGSPFGGGGGSSNNSVFGQTNSASFGTAAAPPAGAFGVQAKPFSFGGTNTSNQPDSTSKSFSFGQNAVAKPEANLFSFGGNSGGNSAAPTPNIFNPPPNVSVVQPTSGGFSFNSPPFGSLSQPAQNGTFNFGSNVNSAPKAGFSFGAPAAAAAAPAVQPTVAPPVNAPVVFNFGAPPNLPPTGSGGFNFGSSDVKPNFNFTGGATPPTFSAGPGTDKPRVIRRAVRRTQR